MLQASPRRGILRRALLPLMLLVVGVAVSGCLHVQAAISVSVNDEVSGTVTVAALPSASSPNGPGLSVPADLAGQASTKAANSAGYAGTELDFQDLSFDQFAELIASNSGGHFQATLQRSGDLVSFSGSADLTQLPVTGSSVQIKISLPGTVLQTDGTNSNGTVSWTLRAGTVSTFGATAQYTAPGDIHSWTFWALVLGGAGVLIAVFLALLALLARRISLRKDEQQEGGDPRLGGRYRH